MRNRWCRICTSWTPYRGKMRPRWNSSASGARATRRAHLFKGETELLKDISSRLAAAGINARVAVADTPGCAWAVARCGSENIVAPGRIADALGGLPVSALRVSQKTVESLHD